MTGMKQAEQIKAALEARESNAAASLRAEMLAEGVVEREDDTLMFRHNGREFMVEVRCLDVTGHEASMDRGTDA